MNYAEIFWNNIASLVLIPTSLLVVITIVLKLKNAQIDSLKQQNETLKERVKSVKMFRVSEVEKNYKTVKNLYQEAKKEVDKLSRKEWDGAAKKLKDKETLTREQVVEIVRLFEVAITYLGLLPHNMGQSASGEVSSTLYMMEGPIGVLWRELVDKRKQEALQKVKERKPDSLT